MVASVSLAAFSTSVLSDDRLLYQLENRVEQLEQRIGNSGMLSIAEDVNRLQAEVRSLRGDIERLQYENNQAKIRQREMYLDLERRIQAVEQNKAPTVSSAADSQVGINPGQDSADQTDAGPDSGTQPAVVNLQVEEKAYLSAFELLKQGRYPDAIKGFSGFLAQYPQSVYADNAQYWLGEAYYVSRDFPESLQSFNRLVEVHPQSSKIPGALLKIGYIYYERGDYDQARSALTRITRDFTESSAANLARQRLQRMDTEGR